MDGVLGELRSAGAVAAARCNRGAEAGGGPVVSRGSARGRGVCRFRAAHRWGGQRSRKVAMAMAGNDVSRLALEQLFLGYRVTQGIHVAARLGLADLLKDGPRTAEDLAQVTATHAPALY